MLVFFDTEYTGLTHPVPARKLLSLALVAEDGSAEFYAELDDWSLADCDPWVQRHVVPLLTVQRLTRDAARASLKDWFAARPRSVQAACDSDTDWYFLLQLLGDRPPNLAAQRHDLAPLIDTASYNNKLTAYFAKGHPEHHALHDARAYRLGWLAWMDARKSKPDVTGAARLLFLKERQRKDAEEVAAGLRDPRSLLMFQKGDLNGYSFTPNPASEYERGGDGW